jgi:hypothetical protein
MAEVKYTPAQVLDDFRGALVPGCDLAVVDEFMQRYLEAGDAARAEAARLERLHDAAQGLLDALRETLALIRRDAPHLSGKVLGRADDAIAKATSVTQADGEGR